ncbi:MAG: WD40/YVTN/BNR-like repeat-containing protein, partial [Micromonosporaceae bacterium]
MGLTVEWSGWPDWTAAAVLLLVAVALLVAAWLEWRGSSRRSSAPGGRIGHGSMVPPDGTTTGQAGREVFTSRRKAYDPVEWSRANVHKRQMPTFAPFELHLDRGEEALIQAATAPVFLPRPPGDRAGKQDSRTPPVTMTEVANPAPGASLGYAGPVVKLAAAEPFFLGVVIFPLMAQAAPPVVAETIRVFRWRDESSSFELVEPSGVTDRYAWARVSSPGIYTLIGLPADPFKQVLVRVTSALAPTLVGMSEHDRAEFLSSVGRTLANRQWFTSFDRPTMQAMFLDGWLPPPGFGFDDLPDGPAGRPGGGRLPGGLPDGGLPDGWDPAGWDPDDDICPRMPWLGWPERWLVPIVDWHGPVRLYDPGWVHQGPINVPGHSTEVQVDPSDHRRIYTATANGGLWVLDDVTRYPAGSRWRPLTDLNENLNLQCLAIAPSDPLVLYYADGASRLFRSADRGGSWARTRDATFGLANRILVDPTNADTVYLAAEDGFFRSFNAGRDWDTLYTGAVTDAVMDHQDARTIYLGVRTIGVVKTTTAGAGTRPWSTVFDWSNASTPTGTEIRLALGRQRTAATRTVVARLDQEVFVNQNGGVATTGAAGWSSKGKVGGDGYGWWCFALGVSPHDDRIILAGSQDLYRTATGGAPWTKVGGYYTAVHPDFWDVTFDPDQVGVVYCANDGGVYRSTDSGATWEYLENRLSTAQLYATGVNGNRAVSGMYHQ